jgi:hypothetical protein
VTKKLHVLPGDAYVREFKEGGIDGEMLVCRECLVEGDLSGADLNEFFENRAAFINTAHDEDPAAYSAEVASQFKQLLDLPSGTEVNLWFEYELFCSVNMWFCLDLLANTAADVYRVAPIYRNEENRWDGFAGATSEDMQRCFESRAKLTLEDIRVGADLWRAYRLVDRDTLRRLSNTSSPAFPYLKEVCEAAIEIDSRPAEIIRQIQAVGGSTFEEIFPEFRRRAGVYGFGDGQVRRLIESA